MSQFGDFYVPAFCDDKATLSYELIPRVSWGAYERMTTKYVTLPRLNWRTRRDSMQLVLDPECPRAVRKKQ